MKTNTIGFIGGGRITRIFLQGFKNKSVKFNTIIVYDTNADTLNKLKQQFPEIEITDSPTQSAKQNTVILAVHPPVMIETLNAIKSEIQPESVVLSLAPKITIGKMSELLPTSKIVRMIPNATSFINEGYNPVSFHDSMNNDQKDAFLDLFKVLGRTFEVDEDKLEGYAIVSAMLPTYFWFQWKKIEEIAQKTGLTKQEALDTLNSTLKYGLELFYDSGYSHEQVMDLIPVKPIGESENEINSIYETKLMGLYEKIKPAQSVSVN